jgi:hypothetical protein
LRVISNFKNNFSIHSNRISTIVMISTIIFITIDTTIIRIYFYSIFQISIQQRILLYFVITFGIVIGQFFILRYINDKTSESRKRNVLHFKKIFLITFFLQGLILIFLTIISSQIYLQNRYTTFSIIGILILSYSSASFYMLLLSAKLISLLKANRNYLLFFYGVSVFSIAFNLIFTILYMSPYLFNQPQVIKPYLGYVTPHVSSVLLKNIQIPYFISSITSFILMWISTTLIYRKYILNLNWKYWMLLIASMFYFIIQYIPIENVFIGLKHSDPLFFALFSVLIFTYTKPLGGLLFGLAFWLSVWSLKRNNIQVDQMSITAYGIVFLFISAQTTELITAPFPPFGVASISMVSLASFMILVGIYSSTISVTRDKQILLKVRRTIEERYSLLGTLALSENRQETKKLIVNIYQKIDAGGYDETGIKSSLTLKEINEYCDEVMEEIKKIHPRKHKSQ